MENSIIEADVKLSKTMAYLLRHGAIKAHLKIKSDGFVKVEKLLRKIGKDYTFEDVKRVVENDQKNRYTLRKINNVWEIAANQGYSIPLITELNLKPVSAPDFDIIHGTSLDKWKIINSEGSKGLSRMKRNHIHFAKGMDATSGFRKTAQIFIFIDFEKATQDGIKFFESENGVILSSGDASGFVNSKYFKKVVTKQGEILLNNDRKRCNKIFKLIIK